MGSGVKHILPCGVDRAIECDSEEGTAPPGTEDSDTEEDLDPRAWSWRLESPRVTSVSTSNWASFDLAWLAERGRLAVEQAEFSEAAKPIASALVTALSLHGPGFVCGVCALGFTQWLFRVGTGGHQHMLDGLHSEVEQAKQQLMECRSSCGSPFAEMRQKHAGVAASQFSQNAGAFASAPEPKVIHLAGVPEPAIPAAAAAAEAAAKSTWSMWSGLFLFVLDVGLLYSFLYTFTPASIRDDIQACLEPILSRLGITSLPTNGSQPARQYGLRGVAVAPLYTPRTPSEIDYDPYYNFTPRSESIPPSTPGREGTPIRQRTPRTPRVRENFVEEEQPQPWPPVDMALVLASILGMLAVRCSMSLVELMGLNFFRHLFVYTVVTVRVCLLVLFILF
mmetsp:Transcript_67200/g.160995  ORF Transcript_67200/g.160995 Transcript_67200/m.160995 type:complete len:394 (+) Transcript_67200:39-1220(+)